MFPAIVNSTFNQKVGPIGVFDSGYGGLTILSEIKTLMPQYDYVYLGDNARAPYGNRSFELVYEFTLQAVEWFFVQGCPLVVLACNTASAKALRSIQQKNLPVIAPSRRVLGVIRPTAELVGGITKSGHVGVLGTVGTVQSQSYEMEINKLHPGLTIAAEACPMWVPLVENREYDKPGADYFVKQHIDSILQKDAKIDTLILGCTHYPLLMDKIKASLPENVTVVAQGKHVAERLQDYLRRHPEIDERCTKNRRATYFTTESPEKFAEQASIFLKENIRTQKTVIDNI
ncbi:MAG: glutamate racemase [Dysgonamonadaceae bacterium]|nr:glutamate racemase [Dysgonamonadaceae bacterium]